MKYLSEAELYFSAAGNKTDNVISVDGEDYKHIVKVMRHSSGDEIYITNGKGEIFLSVIKEIKKEYLIASVKDIYRYENKYSNIIFCLSKLKSNDRLEFALEKCTELGITNFIIFDSERAIKKSSKTERWHKIVLSAMKQSLRSFLPAISIISSINEIIKFEGRKILLEQSSDRSINSLNINNDEKNYFIFGPEGGFNDEEISLFEDQYNLAENRLRTETAVIKCASIILI